VNNNINNRIIVGLCLNLGIAEKYVLKIMKY